MNKHNQDGVSARDWVLSVVVLVVLFSGAGPRLRAGLVIAFCAAHSHEHPPVGPEVVLQSTPSSQEVAI